MPAGEAASVSATDAASVGRTLDVTARASGALVSFVVVACLLLSTSVLLGLVVLVGVPVLVLGVGPLIRPLHRRQGAQRAAIAAASTLAADTVSGLRDLRGIGGEAELLARYRAASRRTREAGVALARVEATLSAVEVLLPGLLLVVVTVVGVRLALAGSISAGQLVSFYGYAAFLVTPLRTATEFADKLTRAVVAAGKVVELLRMRPLREEPALAVAEPPLGVVLTDLTSGIIVEPGVLTAVACVEPGQASALAERLGGHVDAPVLLGDVLLSDLPLSVVRRRVVVADASPWLFRGRLRDELDPFGTHTADEVLAALSAASAGRPGRPARRPGYRTGGAGPRALRWPASARRPGTHAAHRRRRPGPRRADLLGRRAHRGTHRFVPQTVPSRPPNGPHDHEPARARDVRCRRAAR